MHLILVESYGQTVIERPFYTDAMRATFDLFESVLGASGYSIVSSRARFTHLWRSFLDSLSPPSTPAYARPISSH